MRHARDLHIEFDAAEEDVPVVVAGMVERRLASETTLGRISEPSIYVSRDVESGVGA